MSLSAAPVKAEPGDLLALNTDAGWVLCLIHDVTKSTRRACLAEDAAGRMRKVGPHDDVRVAPRGRVPEARYARWREVAEPTKTWQAHRDWLLGEPERSEP